MSVAVCEPDLIETQGGCWLAVTPVGHPYRIGVLADSPEVAEQRFDSALEAWRELHERPRLP